MSLTEAFSAAAALYPSLKSNEYIQMTCDVYLARMHDKDTPVSGFLDKIMVSENVFFSYEQATRSLNIPPAEGLFGIQIPYKVREFHSASAANVDGDVPTPPYTFTERVKIVITESQYPWSGIESTELLAVKSKAIIAFNIDNPNATVVTDTENRPDQIKMLEMKNFKVSKGKNLRPN